MKTYDPANAQHRRDLAEALRAALTKAKFVTVKMKNTKEEVWAFETSNPRVRVLVYTTIERNEARSSGKDAIRASLVYKNETGDERGLVKHTRVNRTGDIEGIVERTLHRVRKVFNEGKKSHFKCEHCGAPTFKSKVRTDRATGKKTGGNDVCMEFCWKKPKQPRPQQQRTGTDNRPAEPAILDYPHIPF